MEYKTRRGTCWAVPASKRGEKEKQSVKGKTGEVKKGVELQCLTGPPCNTLRDAAVGRMVLGW